MSRRLKVDTAAGVVTPRAGGGTGDLICSACKTCKVMRLGVSRATRTVTRARRLHAQSQQRRNGAQPQPPLVQLIRDMTHCSTGDRHVTAHIRAPALTVHLLTVHLQRYFNASLGDASGSAARFDVDGVPWKVITDYNCNSSQVRQVLTLTDLTWSMISPISPCVSRWAPRRRPTTRRPTTRRPTTCRPTARRPTTRRPTTRRPTTHRPTTRRPTTRRAPWSLSRPPSLPFIAR